MTIQETGFPHDTRDGFVATYGALSLMLSSTVIRTRRLPWPIWRGMPGRFMKGKT